MNKYFRMSGLCRLCLTLLLAAYCCKVLIVYAEPTAPDAHDAEHADENHADENYLELTPDQIHYAGITIEQAGPAALRESLPLYGLIVPNAEREQLVAARFPGLIRQVFKKVGDRVAQGDVLATVESNESLKPYAVVASLSGIVVQRQANVGEQSGDRTLFVIGDYSTVWVNLSVFPGDLTQIHTSQKVRICSVGGPLCGDGTITAISPVGNSATQTTTATVLLDNADGRWVPGRFVNAEVVLSESEIPLTVKNAAVQVVEEQNVVFVESAGGFEVRAVQLGRNDGSISEVLAGLKAGESYVADNSFVLKSELGKEGADHGH
jgi:cobalt-zinc-cadmium efflux system membrane fusion protein